MCVLPCRAKRIQFKSIKWIDIPLHLRSILFGLALGDLNIEQQYVNARLRFSGSIIHGVYIIHLFSLFSQFCGSPLMNIFNRVLDTALLASLRYLIQRATRGGVPQYSSNYWGFQFFFHELFYVNGVKVVPLTIGDFLNALV
jgi:hypothetical protein